MNSNQRETEVAKVKELLKLAKSSRRETKFLESLVREHGLCEMRTASTTKPKAQAIAILKALGEGKVVRLSAVGNAVSTKGLTEGLVERMKNPYHNLQFKPLTEFKELTEDRKRRVDDETSEVKECEVFSSIDTLIYDRNGFENFKLDTEDEDVILVDVLNNSGLIEKNIKYYAKRGYDVMSMTGIVTDGRTSYIYIVYNKRK